MRNTMSIHCVWFCKGISTTNKLLREREAVWLCNIDTNLHWIDHFDRYSMIKSNESWCKIRERERTNERAQTSIYFMNYLIICSVALGIPCFLYTFYGRGAPALARFESIVRSFHMALWFWLLFFFRFYFTIRELCLHLFSSLLLLFRAARYDRCGNLSQQDANLLFGIKKRNNTKTMCREFIWRQQTEKKEPGPKPRLTTNSISHKNMNKIENNYEFARII